ncbi:hypothetical protein BOTBODRAFT_181943 [Botryobasidium botryosum FD-172 SS1]|uniref:Uncharacterized protein n=1 Tax=Botryobasidium botryosum (strain FD-172 SS1) TaxID=930990 RepID=A0A067LS46_BOTB1|nr:hypothetical protein BOTBODRAFT_181943 [Botryobasidium botryosum FD-172 SS1]
MDKDTAVDVGSLLGFLNMHDIIPTLPTPSKTTTTTTMITTTIPPPHPSSWTAARRLGQGKEYKALRSTCQEPIVTRS